MGYESPGTTALVIVQGWELGSSSSPGGVSVKPGTCQTLRERASQDHKGSAHQLWLKLGNLHQDYNGLPRVPSVTARVACSGTRLGSDRMLVDVLSWRREFRTAGKRG